MGSAARLDNTAAGRLLFWNVVVFFALVAHDLDHLRQAAAADYAIPTRLFVGNASVYIPTVVAMYLSWRRDRRARVWTQASAAIWLVGFVAVHLIGAGSYYGYWETTYPRLGVDAASWFLFVLPVLVFVTTIVVAWRLAGARPRSQ